MKLKLLLLTCFICMQSFCYTDSEKDSLSVKKDVNVEDELITSQFVHFPELDEKFPIKKSFTKITSPEFTFDNIKREFPAISDDVVKAKAEAKEGFKKIDSTGRWIGSFRNEDIQVLPVGIKKTVNEVEYQLGFTKAVFNKDYTELTVFVKVILPQSDERGLPIELFFGANNVKLSHQGGIVGDANLVLLGDVFIPFNGGNWLLILKGGFDYKTGNTQNKTFVTINCDGVKEMGIEGEVQFSRNMILPVDPTGKPLPEKVKYTGAVKEPILIDNRVKGEFRAIASDWNDLIVEISLSPFVLAGQEDKFMFSVNNAVFDFSDLRTENVNFPQYYHDKGLLLPSPETWRGVYVQSLQIGMPEQFKTTETISKKSRVAFEAANLLIDNYGVSGYFAAKNLIPLESGRTSESKAWAFSVDEIGIELAANRLVGAGFAGRVVLPVSKLKTGQGHNAEQTNKLGLGYAGIISEDEYSLTVSTLDTINFDVFKAKAQLLPNSGVELAVIDGSFRPKAVLNGRLAISASQKDSMEREGEEYTVGEGEKETKKTIQFKGIEFQNLVLQTESPIIKVDYFGYKDEVKLANFPVSIANIGFRANDYEAGIEFDIMVNLMKKGFAGGATVRVIGKFEEQNRRQRWKFNRVELTAIDLSADLGGMKISGSLQLMEDDPEYGDGFSAEVRAEFGKIKPITAKAIFGRKDFRYWYVDAAVHGLVIQAGPLTITGFAGGAYYRMKRRPGGNITEFSPSGLSYIPNKSTSLGVKAMIYGAIGSETAVSIGAGFEIEFNNRGGVNRLGFFGEASIMKAFDIPNPMAKLTEKLEGMVGKELEGQIDKLTAGKDGKGNVFLEKADTEYEAELSLKASIKAKLGIQFDFVNKSFHAQLDIFVNVAGGIVQGRASQGRAGWGVIHISPDEWYFHMGTPTDRLGLKIGVGSFSLETGGYFMMGDRIPGSPPPPPEVAEILGVDAQELDYMRDLNALGDGKGFAFGADFKIDTGDLNFLILYARFKAGVGFDIMLKDYGEARCKGSSDAIGIDGWYANGQSYAYLQGELGINIKLFFVRKKIPIIKGGAAVLLQGKGPNPFWFRGYVGGYYDLLGGLVKGSFRFKMTIGKECELVNAGPLGGIKMITDLTPKDASNEIDVFAAPQAAFAMKVNEPIIIPEDDGDKTYKVILERFNVINEKGEEIIGELDWGRMNDRATFISDDILPPDTKLKVTVQVSFQEKINGVFRTILEEGQKAIEIEERNFVTGGAPDHIPLHNIQYSYPVVDQQLFYSGEYGNGYIQLQRGQDYLFDDSQWKSVVKYVDEGGAIAESEFGYNNADNKVVYKFPKVSKETKYLMSIVSSPKGAGSSTSSNQTTTDKTTYDEDNTSEIRKNQAQNIIKDGEIDRLSYEFKSSKYKTFANKVNAISFSSYNVGKINSDVIFLFNRADNYEGFDLVELEGNLHSENKPLVVQEALLTDNYFKEDINPILYANYPVGGKYQITRRDTNILGVPPRRALPIESDYVTSLENDVNRSLIQTHFPYRYNLARIYKEDFVDLRDQVYSDFTQGIINGQHPAMSLTNEAYYFMRYGKYKVKMNYMLPGGIKGSEAKIDFKNPLRFR